MSQCNDYLLSVPPGFLLLMEHWEAVILIVTKIVTLTSIVKSKNQIEFYLNMLFVH